MKENVLFILSDKIALVDIPYALLQMKIEVQIYDKEITLQQYKEDEKRELRSYLSKNYYSLVIMQNFSPMVSDVCQEKGIKYISWILDSPQIDLYTKSYYNSCNYIFVFDKKQKERLEFRGIPHLYHLPLAANAEQVSTLRVTEQDVERFSGDISFVGGLYEQNVFNDTAKYLPVEIRNKLIAHIKEHMLHWEKGSSIYGCLTADETAEILKTFHIGNWIDMDPTYFLETQFFSKKIAEMERICVLNALALSHQVRLYTGSNTENLENVEVCGKISYNEEAPKVFHLSKINLNITLRSIETGVPQRVFDIMCAGGFVLSNYQEELAELFVPDEEIVLFYNMEGLIQKVRYYLTHEQERIRIAVNGYRKVCEYYNYPKRLQQIFDIVQGDR